MIIGSIHGSHFTIKRGWSMQLSCSAHVCMSDTRLELGRLQLLSISIEVFLCTGRKLDGIIEYTFQARADVEEDVLIEPVSP